MSSRQLAYASPPSSTETSTASMQSKMTNELVQYAMNFANDSMHTSLCLQFPAKSIAQACVYMSAQYCRMRTTGQSWLDLLDSIDMDSLACKFFNSIQTQLITHLFVILPGYF